MYAGCKISPRLLKEYERARQLRSSGVPMKQIAKRLEVSPGTVHRWTTDIELNPEHKAAIDRGMEEVVRLRNERWSAKWRARRRAFQREGRERARREDKLHHAGCMLYWAEGAKHRNALTFANSSPAMVRLFMRFLLEVMEVDPEVISVRLNVYMDNGLTIEQIEAHWLEFLGLPPSCFRKHTLDNLPSSSTGRKKHRLPYGVCSVRVNSTDLVQHIFGAIQEYADFEEPAWLG